MDDFNTNPVKTTVGPHNAKHFDFEVNITLEDDTIQEPEEYFLLVLDVQQSDASKDKITVDAERRCLRVHIAQSLEGELSLIAHTRNKVS